MLTRAGFAEVYSLEGGIHAWNGLINEGLPDTKWFLIAETPAQLLALAWLLEEGTRRFYAEIGAGMENPQTQGIFSRLAQAEVNHKEMLIALWPEFTGSPEAPAPPTDVLENPPAEVILESGISLQEGLRWCKGRSDVEILELAMSMETAAYDRYLRMVDETPMENGRNMFLKLAEEERNHLRRLGTELDRL